MEKCKVFYSWQSDLPNSTNRSFIQKALEEAAKSIRSDDSIEIDPVIDRDTAGVPGSPDIANTIFSKIDGSDIFACDVSIINQGDNSRPTPNPNVLIELGYALKELKSKRIIMIMNTDSGGPELLPFDLSKKRVSTYCINENNENKSKERKKLTQILDNAIRTILSHADNSKTKGTRSGDKEKLKEECEDVLNNGNEQEWRELVDELWREIPKQIFEWKPKAEQVWTKSDTELEAARLEAVEICLPSIVPILVAIKNGREDLWKEAVGSLRKLYLLRRQILRKAGGGYNDVIEIGSHMLYIAGSIGMAIAAEIKQLDFVNRWMQLAMPAEEYEEIGEKPWLEVYTAHHLWGNLLPGHQKPFADILKICESDYITGFFPDKDRFVKYLFLGNLAQSLFELRCRIKGVKNLNDPSDTDKQKLLGDLKVWPLWVLMDPEEFKAATWELFESSQDILSFASSNIDKIIFIGDFWTAWKGWKAYCAKRLMGASRQMWPRMFHSDWLLLPGEPMQRNG